MPNIRIANTTPNIRDNNSLPNIRIQNPVANIRVANALPNIRVTQGGSNSYLLVPATSFGGFGYPLGILMAITYTKLQTVPANIETLSSDFKPNIRLTNI